MLSSTQRPRTSLMSRIVQPVQFQLDHFEELAVQALGQDEQVEEFMLVHCGAFRLG